MFPSKVSGLKSQSNISVSYTHLKDFEWYYELWKELMQDDRINKEQINVLKEEDILFTDIRFEPYANVIFDHNIYEARKIEMCIRDRSRPPI